MSSSFQFEPTSLVWKQDVLQVLMSSLVIKDKISARLNNLSLLNKNSNLHSHPEHMKVLFFLVYSSETNVCRDYSELFWIQCRQNNTILDREAAYDLWKAMA